MATFGKQYMIHKDCIGCQQAVGMGSAMCPVHGPASEINIPERVEAEIPQSGKKYDDGKAPMSLLPSAALTVIAQVLAFGARKYDPWNWKGGFAWSRLASAALRHLFAWLAGEDKDPESGLSHLAHAGCCILFLLDFEVNKLGTDDRYRPK